MLREFQNQHRDALYLYSEYDPQIYYPKLLSKDTFASQVRCQLYTALEEHNKLPAAIIVIVGNKDIDLKVYNPEYTRKVWSALFTEMQRAIRTRKEDLPSKAKFPDEPQVFIANIFPRGSVFSDKCDLTHETFKTKRRRLNGILPQVASSFEFKVLAINGILPENSELFVMNTGQLNGKGIKEFWNSLSKELKVQDFKAKERNKSKIIQQHFDEQREQRRLLFEKKKAEKDRYSLPRGHQFDRGDGNFTQSQRKDRARSVPGHRGDRV